MNTKKLQMCVMVYLYGDNRLRRFQENILQDPHFVGFNYFGGHYRVFFSFDETEDYIAYYEDLEFRLSMGDNRKSSLIILSLVKGEQPNFCFNLAYSEYMTAKAEYNRFPDLV